MDDYVSYLITVGLLFLGLSVIFLGYLVAFLICYSDKDNNEK